MKNYVKFLHYARIPLAVLFIGLFIFSIDQAKSLKIKSDFKELLPDNFESVKVLDRIGSRVAGTGSLIVAIEGKNPEKLMSFADDLVKKVKTLPPGYVDHVEYNVKDVKDFFEKNKYLYMDLKDLKEIKDRLDHQIQQEKLKTTGIYIDLDESDDSKNFSTTDIEEKYRGKAGSYDFFTKGYFFNKSQDLLVVILRPPGTATGVEFSRDLVSRVQGLINEMNPSSYDPTLKVGLTGKFRRVLFEYQTLIEDIISTVALCLILVGLAVLLYYRRFRMLFLMAWAVLNGAAWAFALTKWHIGYLTTQTAFLGSLIIGNGVNYSLILMSRYVEERRSGKPVLDSLQISIPATISGTLASGLTTSVSFATLLITEIKGFSHFGFIGGLGMFLCWVSAYTVLPVFLSISESIWPTTKKGPLEKFKLSFMPLLSKHFSRHARTLTAMGVAFTLASVPLIVLFVPHSLEYDFSKLRMKSKGTEVSEEAVLSNRVDEIFGRSSTPAIVVADRIDQVKPLCDEIMRKNALDPEGHQVVQSCKSIYSSIPEDQDEKIRVLADLRKVLEDKSLKFLNPEQKRKMNDFKKTFVAKKITLEELPETILKNFREKNGAIGNIVFVYSGFKVPLWDGKNLIRFANLIRRNELPNGDVVLGSGDAAIFADMLQAVIHDGPRATVLAFLAVCLAVALIFREKKGTFFIIGTLSLGVLWMFGLVALFNIKINFFNFIAIPTTFGIGVDYACNIYQRYREEGKGGLPKVLKTTGGAVVLCSVTTIIGYLTLIIAKNQALVSFGWVGIIGEATCLAAAVFIVPALVMRFERRRKA